MHFIFVSIFMLFHFVSHFKPIFVLYLYFLPKKNCITRCIFFVFIFAWNQFSIVHLVLLLFLCMFVCSLHSLREWYCYICRKRCSPQHKGWFFSFFFCIFYVHFHKYETILLFDDVFFNGKICENFSSHDANLRRKQKQIKHRKKCNHL